MNFNNSFTGFFNESSLLNTILDEIPYEIHVNIYENHLENLFTSFLQQNLSRRNHNDFNHLLSILASDYEHEYEDVEYDQIIDNSDLDTDDYISNIFSTFLERLLTESSINESFENTHENIEKTERTIKNIENLEVLFDKESSKNINCPICLEDFTKNSKVVQLKCKHQYHKDCIVESVKYNPICSCCKTEIDVL